MRKGSRSASGSNHTSFWSGEYVKRASTIALCDIISIEHCSEIHCTRLNSQTQAKISVFTHPCVEHIQRKTSPVGEYVYLYKSYSSTANGEKTPILWDYAQIPKGLQLCIQL